MDQRIAEKRVADQNERVERPLTVTASIQSVLPAIEPADARGLPQAVAQDRLYVACRLLWDRRRFLIRWLFYGSLLSVAVALLIPSLYTSQSQLMPPDAGSGSAGMLAALAGGSGLGGGATAGMAADLLGLRTSGGLFISILTSNTVEDRIIDRFDLRKVYGIRTYERTRKKLEDRTSVGEQKKSGVITIVVSDRDPQRAAAIARSYVEELNRHLAEVSTSSAHRERIFLEERLQVVKQELDQAAKSFSEFSSKNTAIDIKEQSRAMVEAAATLQGQEIAAQSELRGLEQIYASANVRVRSVKARIQELEEQLERIGGARLEPQSDPTDPALYPSIRQLPVLGLTYADLYRKVKINETIFEVLTQQYELARVQEAKEVAVANVIDVAEPAERKAWPPRTLIALGGALLSFSLAAAWVFGREAWEGANPRDPKRLFVEEIAAELGRTIGWKRGPEQWFRRNGRRHDGRNGDGNDGDGESGDHHP